MSSYKKYAFDQLEEHLSNFLISSWSYSKVTTFARNEKAFEMQYIYGLYGRKSATNVAGNAYHEALRWYFQNKQKGKTVDLIELEQTAFAYIDDIKSNDWKLGKTTPTVESCVLKATETVSKLLKNFMLEKGVYEDDTKKILDIEIKIEEWLTVNGVDIPLPCHMVIDLVIETNDGKIAVIDHKSKASYTDEEELALSVGVQAITYVLGYEAYTGQPVDEVWFVENKHSQNKDKSPQLQKNIITIDENTRRLYEALLYEPLKRLVEAVSNPDYVYLINQYDNLVSQAELHDFWCRTMIPETTVEDFNVEESKKALVTQRIRKIRDTALDAVTPQVIKKFKENASKFIQYDLSSSNMTAQEKVEHVLRTFNIPVKVAHVFKGYSSCTFLLEVSAGIKISSIYSYRKDIANALDVTSVRIGNNLVVHEGRSYLAVEFEIKRESDLLYDESLLVDKRIPLGKDNLGNLLVWNLENQTTPHMLVCGSTGSGKTIYMRNIVDYATSAGIQDIIIMDPKREFINKFKFKNALVVCEIEEIEEMMQMMVSHMNDMIRNGEEKLTLILIDELADAINNSRKGEQLKEYEMVPVGMYKNGAPKMQRKHTGTKKSLEENLQLLLQKGRSCGIRIVAGLQRASTKIINGDAKTNFPVLVCFKVTKEVDSMVVLDEPGAESLAGKGDGLIKSPEYDETVRFQAFYKP